MTTLIDSPLWRTIAETWPVPQNLPVRAEEHQRLRAQAVRNVAELVASALHRDMPALCAALGRETQPDATIAARVLHEIAATRPELLTVQVMSSWLSSVALAQQPALERFHRERSKATVSAIYDQFIDRVPIGAPFDELIAILGEPTQESSLTDEFSHWAAYVGGELELQLWADNDGRYCAVKFT